MYQPARREDRSRRIAHSRPDEGLGVERPVNFSSSLFHERLGAHSCTSLKCCESADRSCRYDVMHVIPETFH